MDKYRNCSFSELFEYLEEERREAYVRAVMRQAETDDVLGYIGSRVPVELFCALDLMALPVYGVDGAIRELSEEKGLCALADATLTYAKTDKCPLLHSSRLIVVDDVCPVIAREIPRLSHRTVHLYCSEDPAAFEALRRKLEAVYDRVLTSDALSRAAAESNRVSSLLSRIKTETGLGGRDVYVLEYYLNFLSPEERAGILERVLKEAPGPVENPRVVRVQSGAGIYRQIDRLIVGHYRIEEGEGCQGCLSGVWPSEPMEFFREKYSFGGSRKEFDFVYRSCPFAEGTEIDYED